MLSSLRLIAKPSLGASSFLRPVAAAAASYSTGGKAVFLCSVFLLSSLEVLHPYFVPLL